MNDLTNNWSVQVIGMLAITAATTAVFWIAQGFDAALPVGLVLLAFTAVVHFGRRRSNTLEVMSGPATSACGPSTRRRSRSPAP